MEEKEKVSGTTEIVFILDKSGSMHGKEADTIGGFNSVIEEQKKLEGKALVSTVLFSSYSQVLHDRVDLKEVQPLDESKYIVGGNTALLDAVGNAIKHIRNIHKYARSEDIPQKTIFVITTDGYENASRFYSFGAIKKLIAEQENKGWEFIFLGANINSAEFAESMGIRRERAVDFSVKHMDDWGATVSDAVCYCRSGISIEGSDWAKKSRERMAKRSKQ